MTDSAGTPDGPDGRTDAETPDGTPGPAAETPAAGGRRDDGPPEPIAEPQDDSASGPGAETPDASTPGPDAETPDDSASGPGAETPDDSTPGPEALPHDSEAVPHDSTPPPDAQTPHDSTPAPDAQTPHDSTPGPDAQTPHESAPGPEALPHDGEAVPHDSAPATGAEAPDDNAPGPEAVPHGRWRPWLRRTALISSVLVLVAAGASWMIYQKLEGNITTDTGTAEELKRYEAERPTAMVHNARNVLLIGSDTRGDGNDKYGRDNGTQRSDTTILLHLAANRKSATAVSIPRDLMVDVPSCRKPDGSRSEARFAQFNSAFEVAGPACTIRTVENLTGIRVDHHMIVDFNGFKRMVDAVHGVEICLKDPISDAEARLELPAGRQKLDGEQALGYVRARYSIGNGSDTERMDRQQQFLGALVKKVQSNGVLLNPTRLYPVLDAATSSLTTDSGLDSLRELYELVRGLRKIPTDHVQFLTVPRRAYSLNANRDELVQPDAAQLFNLLRNDLGVTVSPKRRQGEADATATARPDAEPGTRAEDPKPDDPSAEPTDPAPTYRGTTAANSMCG
ncbi:LCP family glycopolymer transferase [Streptomyces sp. 8N706]|uniref:LCP family glycopolymer transferase n=1 Tax=Streptomyces sp. 8N706 TaxID=3457416 RepID=UPI003FD3F00D